MTRGSYAQLSINIQVSRKSQYMLWNFVILISMLVWLSFLTFFMQPSAIDVRLSVALTVILAINVYQVRSQHISPHLPTHIHVNMYM
mgnify:FL=1